MGENTLKRIGYIDIAKCVAIVSVVLGHVLAYDLYGFNTVWKQSLLMSFICSYHMPLFMFLSGLVSITAIQKNVVLNDVIKRVRMLFVPFLVIGSLYSLWRYGNLNFVLSEMKFGYWYLWVLFVFYVITYPICIGGGKLWKYLIAFIIWFVASHYVSKVSAWTRDTASLQLMVSYYPYYLLGNVVKRYKLHDLTFSNSCVFFLSALIWACASFLSFRYSNYVVTTAIILVIMNICKKIDDAGFRANRFWAYIGQNTLYIYVFHYFALQIMKTTCFANFLCHYSNITIDLLIAMIPTVLAVAFSLGVKFVLQREPMVMRWVFGKKG